MVEAVRDIERRLVNRGDYLGDVGLLDYGGRFFDLSTFDEGYVNVLDVIEAPDTDDEVWLALGSIILDDSETVARALASCGWDVGEIEDRRLIADAVLGYAGADPGPWGHSYAWPNVVTVRLDDEAAEINDFRPSDLDSDGRVTMRRLDVLREIESMLWVDSGQ